MNALEERVQTTLLVEMQDAPHTGSGEEAHPRDLGGRVAEMGGPEREGALALTGQNSGSEQPLFERNGIFRGEREGKASDASVYSR
jgi:hypothetical protein